MKGKQIKMKKLAVLALVACLFGCADSKKTLYIYNWAEYIDPELIQKFEDENNCKIVIDNFDSNEAALAKLLAGAAGYDIMFPTSYIVPTLAANSLLQQIDTNKLPNFCTNFDKKFLKFTNPNGFSQSVPYAFGMTGIGWRSDKLNLEEPVSWNVLNMDKSNRICLLDDIREMLGIGLAVNGYSVNSTNRIELEKAVATISAWKKNAIRLDNVEYRTGLVSGQLYLSIGYNSDTLQIQDESPDTPIRFTIPKEGSTCCFDEIVIFKNADTDLAHKFIDFLYVPENAAQNCRYICSAMPNIAIRSLMEKDDLENELMFPTEEILSRLESEKDLGDAIELWNEMWELFKAVR